MIELKKLSVGYGRRTVLSELSLTLEKGGLTAILGLNGSGKSTLLKTLLGIIPTLSGSVYIDGKHLSEMSRNEIARAAAYLPQGKSTPDMTVSQLVLHGRFPHLNYPRRYSAADRRIAAHVMRQVGIEDLAATPLHALSGGMRQNAYIAMALAQDTDYIFLDEPTTYLDIPHQLELMRLLRLLADGGKGVLAVMHDLTMALTFSDRILLLDEGRLLADTSPEELYASGAAERVFGVSIGRTEDGNAYFLKLSESAQPAPKSLPADPASL